MSPARPAPVHEPHKIKTVRQTFFPTYEERKRNLMGADFNVLHLTPQEVTFDMVSWGSSAVSQEQLSGLMVGDEAYAGARNFDALKSAVLDVVGHSLVCPTHNLLGCMKLVVATMVPPESRIPSNALVVRDALTPRGLTVPGVRDTKEEVFTGNVDLDALEEHVKDGQVALIYVETFADAHHPVSLANLQAVKDLAGKYDVPVVLDGSRVVENAWYVQRHEAGQSDRTIAEITHALVSKCDVLQIDGAQAPKSNVGAFISTNDEGIYEKLMNEVVVYEGLHTYGGMAGRTMEVLARGLREMTREAEVNWIMHQAERFSLKLKDAGIPLERGCDGAYIKADEFLPHLDYHRKDTLSVALYLSSGIRAVSSGMLHRDAILPVQIPRLALTNFQLDQIADAIVSLFEQRDKLPQLEPLGEFTWRDQMRYRWVLPDLDEYEFDTQPYLVHTIERVGELTPEGRRAAIEEAGYNTFLLRSQDVSIDLLTDSGTSSMSTDQWAAYEAALPATSSSEEYVDFVELLQDVFGYQYIIPTHQGRAAEHILSQISIEKGQYVPGNMYFTTTKLHQELAGGIFADVIVDEAHDPTNEFPWKGNIDVSKLEALVREHGAEKIAYVSFEHSVNMAGGQPVSMDNMREVHAFCSSKGIPIYFDATRVAENACLIKMRDSRYHETSVRDILSEMMLYGDGCTVSGKKDFLINMGGVLAFRDDEKRAEEAEEMLRVYEGNVTDGGLPAADLAAIAQGVREMLDDRYIRDRVKQTEYLGELLHEAGIPIVRPAGSHAIFLDARRFLPHVDQDQYPAQRLAAEIYVETGVRAMERGNVSKGRDPATGENYRPPLELVRLTIPRRVYSNDHMRGVAEGIIRVWARREEIQGLGFVYEPAKLRFFQGRFEPLEKATATV